MLFIHPQTRYETLLENLLDFDPNIRREALEELARDFSWMHQKETENHNLHIHSFYSFNSESWSPERIAWEAFKQGWYAVGLCDFDVLDGMEEFLSATELLKLRSVVSVETRVFIKELSDVEISSPGEPGISYIMAEGFVPEMLNEDLYMELKSGWFERASSRNKKLINRINTALPVISINYEKDVLPLTPSANPTERHIIKAYVNKAREIFGSPERTANFWSEIFKIPFEEAVVLISDETLLLEKVRTKFVKQGGIGYIQPSPDSFSLAENFIQWAIRCKAIPVITWLDGTSEGEKDAEKLLDIMIGKGCRGLNIIPDRNWNIKDPDQRKIKQAKLNEIILLSEKRYLPVSIGTEMNRPGQPLIDDLSGPVLMNYKRVFLRGARIFTAHTVLTRLAKFSYIDKQTDEYFSYDINRKNNFFEAVGSLPPLNRKKFMELKEKTPDNILEFFEDAINNPDNYLKEIKDE